jgi:hypothetical protein
VLGWTGDQLVVLGERDLRIPHEPRPPSGVAWTTGWNSQGSAKRFAEALLATLGAQHDSDGAPEVFRASDGEMMWLQRQDSRVVLVKGPPTEDMRALAASAYLGAVGMPGVTAWYGPGDRPLLDRARPAATGHADLGEIERGVLDVLLTQWRAGPLGSAQGTRTKCCTTREPWKVPKSKKPSLVTVY